MGRKALLSPWPFSISLGPAKGKKFALFIGCSAGTDLPANWVNPIQFVYKGVHDAVAKSGGKQDCKASIMTRRSQTVRRDDPARQRNRIPQRSATALNDGSSEVFLARRRRRRFSRWVQPGRTRRKETLDAVVFLKTLRST